MRRATKRELSHHGLVFASDDEPGIRRRGKQRVSYLDERTGRLVTSTKALARFRRLAIPPAWVDVWISPNPNAHIQATGRDARGRKQYRYHDDFRTHRDATKFDQLVPFGEVLAAIRQRVDRDLRVHGLAHDRVTAAVVDLLDHTHMRVGNRSYVAANGSYGLTTLRNRHAEINGSTLRIHFTGKSAKHHDVTWADPRLARVVQRCHDLPGQILFQWVDDDDVRHPLVSDDVNDYLRSAAGFDVTSKTFRTWGASVLAAEALAAVDGGVPPSERRAVLRETIATVAGALGNTPAVCRKSYIHPRLLETFSDGTFHDRWQASPARGSRLLTTDERRLVSFLRGRAPARSR